MPMAICGHNGNNETFIGNASSVSLSFYDENTNEIPVTLSDSFIDVFIQSDSNSDDDLAYQQVVAIDMNDLTFNPFFLQNAFKIKSKNASIHIELMPSKPNNTSYLFVLKLGSLPVLNSTYSSFDSFKIFCPSNHFLNKDVNLIF